VRGGERGGGRGGGRGGFGGNREFDRQSADPKAMVKPTEKREGGGKGNWGTTQDVIDDVAAPAPVEAVEAPEEDKEAVEAAGGWEKTQSETKSK
jgi:plasminogen activator inhibitor 1 RNA-binding protein